MTAPLFRCKHVVEAMRWTGDADNRAALAAWFASRGGAGARVAVSGDVAVLIDEFGSVEVPHGHWILINEDAVQVMDETSFAETYEPAVQP